VNASRVCQRSNPSVGNSENVVPLLRNSNSVSEPPVGKGARLLGFSRDAVPGPRSRCWSDGGRREGSNRQSETGVRGDSLVWPGECRGGTRRCLLG
jgi:hypothetical protein